MKSETYEAIRHLGYLLIDLKSEVRELNKTAYEISGQLKTIIALKEKVEE